ncbi:ABC transporter permease [Arthrobacter sp. FW306-2-2C-D06B]|uniref:ABC transporter permease n=1 Tax=Arthrobacter sp. FW306-2-2C-D06B TaxID=2879618 RepID=UPI001F41B6D4|nr:ABC transporter permease [Arthrobacter sp. FW306-2-2C-D06B]UKA60468.1 ABC transporter permease [Arthrobacter sp. FW306-2-2C-D06B]UKA60481.1 ABC transporter permease [Arthrobacter sp. FW306-2-2C-D06B]
MTLLKHLILHYLRLLGSSLLLIFAVVVAMFVLLQLAPGDPIQGLVGDMPVTDEYRAVLTSTFGLDQPVYVRFFTYVQNVLSGNLGFSYANNEPVLSIIWGRLGNTLLLTIPSLVLSAVGGIVLGALAARTRSRRLDAALSYSAIALFSLPVFWLALMLVLLFSVQLGWLPAQGMSDFGSDGVSLSHMVLPVLTLAFGELAFFLRIMRSSMIDVLGQEYIDTARSKGLTPNQVLRRHGLLNSMLPMVSVIGYNLGHALAGAVLVESVFGWPGMGLLMYESIKRSENMVVLGILLVVAITVVVVNILTDVVYGLVDPRVRARMRRQMSGA